MFGCAPKVGLATCKLPNEILNVIEKEEELYIVGLSIEPLLVFNYICKWAFLSYKVSVNVCKIIDFLQEIREITGFFGISWNHLIA